MVFLQFYCVQYFKTLKLEVMSLLFVAAETPAAIMSLSIVCNIKVCLFQLVLYTCTVAYMYTYTPPPHTHIHIRFILVFIWDPEINLYDINK